MTRVPDELRHAVYRANMALVEAGLVFGTFGNVSGVDRKAGLFVIKPSGVPYDQLSPDNMVAVSLQSGKALGGDFRPSSDAPTHLELYRALGCGGVAHTHSECATTLAQARLPLRCMGTTHADYFRGDVPVTRPLTEAEVAEAYERNTGLVIVETFQTLGLQASEVPGVLVANHGPFAWGGDAQTAVEHARVLEYLARIDVRTRAIAPDASPPEAYLIDKHHRRKHGPDAYYGQR